MGLVLLPLSRRLAACRQCAVLWRAALKLFDGLSKKSLFKRLLQQSAVVSPEIRSRDQVYFIYQETREAAVESHMLLLSHYLDMQSQMQPFVIPSPFHHKTHSMSFSLHSMQHLSCTFACWQRLLSFRKQVSISQVIHNILFKGVEMCFRFGRIFRERDR